MEITASSKHIRVSQRKLMLLAKGVKKMSPNAAVVALNYINKSGSLPLKKVLASAIANAKMQNLSSDSLEIKEIQVLPASSMKRFRAVSRGTAHSYKKRMSHVRIILSEVKKQIQKEVTKKTETKEEKSS